MGQGGNLLVVGNGFDIAHGLPTKYEQFLEFCEIIKTKNETLFNDKKQEYNIEDSRNNVLALDDFDDLLSNIQKNLLFDYFQYLSCNEDNIQIGKNWIDFEEELAILVKNIDSFAVDLETLVKDKFNSNDIERKELGLTFEEFQKIQRSRIMNTQLPIKPSGVKRKLTPLCLRFSFIIHLLKQLMGKDYFEMSFLGLRDLLYKDLFRLTKAFEIYLIKFVYRINLRELLPDLQGIKFDYFLSYNYTQRNLTNYNINYENRIYIHGECSPLLKENNMTLGIPQYWKGEDRRNKTNYIQFMKPIMRMDRKTNLLYPSFKKMLKANGYNVYIYGHSIGKSDHDTLKDLFANPKTTVTVFYYKDEEKLLCTQRLIDLLDWDVFNDRVSDGNLIIKQVTKEVEKD